MELLAVETETEFVEIMLEMLAAQAMEGAIHRCFCVPYDGVEPMQEAGSGVIYLVLMVLFSCQRFSVTE